MWQCSSNEQSRRFLGKERREWRTGGWTNIPTSFPMSGERLRVYHGKEMDGWEEEEEENSSLSLSRFFLILPVILLCWDDKEREKKWRPLSTAMFFFPACAAPKQTKMRYGNRGGGSFKGFSSPSDETDGQQSSVGEFAPGGDTKNNGRRAHMREGPLGGNVWTVRGLWCSTSVSSRAPRTLSCACLCGDLAQHGGAASAPGNTSLCDAPKSRHREAGRQALSTSSLVAEKRPKQLLWLFLVVAPTTSTEQPVEA